MNRLQNEQYTRRPLVYIVAVLFFEPIFTQPLGFVPCTAGAVEKFATDAVYYTHIRAHENVIEIVCRLMLEKKKKRRIK